MNITVERVCKMLHISETTLVNAMAAINTVIERIKPTHTTDDSVYYVRNTAELAEAVKKGDRPIMPLFKIDDKILKPKQGAEC